LILKNKTIAGFGRVHVDVSPIEQQIAVKLASKANNLMSSGFGQPTDRIRQAEDPKNRFSPFVHFRRSEKCFEHYWSSRIYFRAVVRKAESEVSSKMK
jgi:hypothetical protein